MTPSGRLCIQRIPADFDPGRDVALGPWCFVGAEHVVPGWEDLPFADPFPTSDDWVAADRLTRRLANRLVPVWADRLNTRHGRSHSPRFWRVLLLNWLAVAVPALWSRYRHGQAVVAQYGGRALAVTVAADRACWGVPSTRALLPWLWSGDGDWQLSSLVVAALAPPAWRLDTAAAPELPPAEPQAPATSRGGAMLGALFGRLPVNHVSGVRLARLPLSLLAALLPRRPACDHYDFADDAVLAAFPPTFLDLLDRFLERVLPASFADGFAAIEAAALAKAYHPGRLLVDAINSEDDAVRAGMAMAHERGERLVGAQHGGTYGTHRAMMAAAETEYRYDAFLSWGWTAQEDCAGRFVPVPSPEMSGVADRHRERDRRLLLVGNSMVVHGTRLGWLPKPQQYLAYRRAKAEFLGALAPEVLAETAYRPYRRNIAVLEDAEWVAAACPGLPLVEGDLTRALLRCRLAVIDHPITTMLTALAANVPTVLYWDPQAWPAARQAEPLFEGLRRAGILHHDPVAAGRQVDRVWGDVPNWWREPEVQRARRAFVAAYARTSPWGGWYWAGALLRLARPTQEA